MFALRPISLVLALVGLSLHAQTGLPTVGRSVPAQTLSPGGATLALNLTDYFTLPGVTGQIVQFDTVQGKFDVGLRPDVAPQNVTNFLGYVQRGDYANSFIHRSGPLQLNGPIAVIQGGGFAVSGTNVTNIPTQAPVPLEYNLPNERGTIAAARQADINSATSQWYFNVQDNTSLLNQSNASGYTVFGRVLGSGMTVVDAIAALPRVNAGGDPFAELPVRNYTSGNVQVSNLVIVNSVKVVSAFPSDASSPSVATFSVAQNSSSNVVAVAVAGSVLTLTPGSPGSSTVTIRATDVNGNTADATFTVTVSSTPPAFTTQPTSLTVATGSTAVLTANATGAVSYQWQRNGINVNGGTAATLVINNAGSADAGAYTLIARNAVGSTTSSTATLTVTGAAPSDVGRLSNLSIRSFAGTGDQTLIVGFALGGSGTSGTVPLLLRAAGPSLTQYGLTGVLADPVATLYLNGNVVAANDNWNGDATVLARAKSVGAFDFVSNSSLDAAIATNPAAASYTMQVTGNGGGTGTALAEMYNATAQSAITATTPRLVNVSARTLVGTGDNVLIAGFVVSGSTAKTVLIRATGPALASFGVAGTLADPKLQLFVAGAKTSFAENDNWGGDPQIVTASAATGAFPLTNGASKDAAILITLPPGNYSAQVSGADGGTGVALIELYEVQ